MARGISELSNKLQQSTIYECLSFDEAWEGVLEDWFVERFAGQLNELPCAVVVPNDAAVQFIKEQLLKRDMGLLGVVFYKPGNLRHYLSKAYNCFETVELRENLHLLMKVVARELKDNAVARAAAIEPEQFVRLADLLEATGWQIGVLKNESIRNLIKKYQEARQRYGMITAQSITHSLSKLSKNQGFAFSNLLVFGFSSKHWGSYNILLSAVRASKEKTLCFLTQDNARLIDQAWLGSWEQELGVSKRIAGELNSRRFAYLSYCFDEVAMPAQATKDYLPEIYIAENILREAEVIVARIAKALVTGEVSRLGVVLPSQTSPLGREVARLLEEEEIAHYNHLGYVGGNSRGRQLFEFWMAWQKKRRLGAFLSFLNELVNEGILQVTYLKAFETSSYKALQTLLTDDLEVIFTYFNVNNNCDPFVAELLQQWRLFPEEAMFQIYFELARKAMELIAWPEDLQLIEQRAGVFLSIEKPIQKIDFLLWLNGVTKPLGRTSKYWGQHEYAYVHLITEEEALLQSWSHLILAGLNQGEWPSKKAEVIFLEDKQIAELNYHSLEEGDQGEGHLTVKDGLSLLLSTMDQYEISKVNFSTLIGMPSKKLILTAHMKDLQRSRDILMSEFLEKVHWISEGVLLDGPRIKAIFNHTKNWISSYKLKQDPGLKFKELVHAYQQRRNIDEAFDEYSFSFQGTNKEALNVSCKAWEEILTCPEQAWSKHILGIERNKFCVGKPLYALAKGTWVHEWIKLEKVKQLEIQAWSESIKGQAQSVYAVVQKTFDALDWPIPDIWKGYWSESLRISLSLSEVLNESLSDCYLFSEHSIGGNPEKDQTLDLKCPIEIPLKGRIDLLAYSLPHLEPQDDSLWILDFKTGVSGSLTENKIKNGTGVQLVLYAMQFYLAGFNNIELSIIQPGLSLNKQIDLKCLLDNNCSIFDAINYIYNNGKLGIRTSMFGLYGNRFTFPLATIKIEEDILKKKWELTHANLSF